MWIIRLCLLFSPLHSDGPDAYLVKQQWTSHDPPTVLISICCWCRNQWHALIWVKLLLKVSHGDKKKIKGSGLYHVSEVRDAVLWTVSPVAQRSTIMVYFKRKANGNLRSSAIFLGSWSCLVLLSLNRVNAVELEPLEHTQYSLSNGK